MASSGGVSKRLAPDTSDGITVYDSQGVERVRIGLLDAAAPTTGDYGIKVISSNGTTVIIDGTTDVFKIVASGTLSVGYPSGSGASTSNSVTVNNVTAGTVNVGVFGFLATVNSPSALHHGDSFWYFDATGHMQYGGHLDHGTSGTTDMVVTVTADAGVNNMVGTTLFARYYVLKEASI